MEGFEESGAVGVVSQKPPVGLHERVHGAASAGGLVVVIGGSVFACCKFCQGCPLNKAGGETEMTKV